MIDCCWFISKALIFHELLHLIEDMADTKDHHFYNFIVASI